MYIWSSYFLFETDELKEQVDDVNQDITALDDQVTVALFTCSSCR